MKKFFENNKDLLIVIGLVIMCLVIFFVNLGVYPLLDADETRYADMSRAMLRSKDFITLYLDGNIFWDKPPLYFWLECLSFWIFKTCNEFTVRFPSVMCAVIPSVALYFMGKKLISRGFGLICALILITCVEYVIFAKVAILDMVLTAFITLSVFAGFTTYFVKQENKKYFWWLFYIFSATASLAKGVPGIVIPFGTMFFIGLWKKNLREFFTPQFILPGLTMFFIIFLPWHILMYKIHGMEFINEYVIKHHLMRFVGSKSIGRMHSVWYFIPVFLVGFLPWSLHILMSMFESAKKIKTEKLPDFVIMSLIGFVFTFIFFSSAKTKLITYILPLYPFAAIFCGYVWYKYIKEEKYKNSIKTASYITFGAFIITGVAIVVMKFFMPQALYADIKSVQICLGALFLISGATGILFLRNNKKIAIFSVIVLTCAFLSAHSLPELFNIWYKFGQNDLMYYAKYARENNLKLAAFSIWERYSLQYYYDGDILYYRLPIDDSYQYVKTEDFEGDFENYVMVIEHKKLQTLTPDTRYKVIKYGRRYDLIYDLDTPKSKHRL